MTDHEAIINSIVDRLTSMSQEWYLVNPEDARDFAYAVVDELGLTEEWAPAYVEHDGYLTVDTKWIYGVQKDAKARAAAFNQDIASRYVTKWVVR
jgi:hypothetical protein